MYTSVLLGIKSAYILKCMYICTSIYVLEENKSCINSVFNI